MGGLGITYFSTNSDKKAAVVERFNRTLKSAMWKYFYSRGTHKWVGVLDDLVASYNSTKHSATLKKPADVTPANEDEVWMTLYGHMLEGAPPSKFRIGDTVRVSRYKSVFAKGYEANFTEELFKIKRVLRGHPNVYEIEALEGEPIIGKFYEEELSLTTKKDNTYRVEKVLRTRKGMALVKWLGYDSKHNSWVPKSDIQALGAA